MYSVLLTGYLFRNAFYRMQLRNSLTSSEAYGTGTTYVAGLARLKPALSWRRHYAFSTAADGRHGMQEFCQHHSVSQSPTQQYLSQLRTQMMCMHLALRSSTSKGRSCDGMFTTTQPRGYQQQHTLICSRERLQSSSARSVLPLCAMSCVDAHLPCAHECVCEQATASEARISATADDSLLAYMKSLEQDHIQSLTRSASPDVLSAMNDFVHRLLGTSLHELPLGPERPSNLQLTADMLA